MVQVYSYLGLCTESDFDVFQGTCSEEHSFRFMTKVIEFFRARKFAHENQQQMQTTKEFVETLVIPKQKLVFDSSCELFDPAFLQQIGVQLQAPEKLKSKNAELRSPVIQRIQSL
jgi:hypothetical protein